MADIYRFFNFSTGVHFYTASAEEAAGLRTNAGFRDEGVGFQTNASQGDAGAVPVYRFFNLSTGVHFYTTSDEERANVIASGGFRDEGIAYYAYSGSGTEQGPLYRFFNLSTGVHFYTASDEERANVIASGGFRDEGIGYYISGSSSTNTIELTNGADALTGTSGNDAFTAVYDPTGGTSTFSNSDSVDGGGGTDTLTLNVLSAANGDQIRPVATNTEKLVLNLGQPSTSSSQARKFFLADAWAQFFFDAFNGPPDYEEEVDINDWGFGSSYALNEFDGASLNWNVQSGASAELDLTQSDLSNLTKLNLNGGLTTISTVAFETSDIQILEGGLSQQFNDLNYAIVEVAELQFDGGWGSLNTSYWGNAGSFLFYGSAAAAAAASIVLAADDSLVGATDLVVNGSDALNLQGQSAGTTANLELRATSDANGEATVTAVGTGNKVAAVTLDSNITGLNLSSTLSSGTQANANVIKASNTDDRANAFANAYAFDFVDTPITPTITITGNHDLTIMADLGVDVTPVRFGGSASNTNGFSIGVNVDASAFTGDLRIVGSASQDTIAAGSGDDILYMVFADRVTGNGGADQFRLIDDGSVGNQSNFIRDFQSGSDKIGLNTIDFANTTATQAGTTLNALDYDETVSTISAIGAGQSGKIVEIQTAQTQDEISNGVAGTSVNAFVLVFNSTTGFGEIHYDGDWAFAGQTRKNFATIDTVTSLTGLQALSASDFVEYLF